MFIWHPIAIAYIKTRKFLKKLIEDYCLSSCKKQTPKNTRFTNPIFNDNNLIVPIGTGKESCIETITDRFYMLWCG